MGVEGYVSGGGGGQHPSPDYLLHLQLTLSIRNRNKI